MKKRLSLKKVTIRELDDSTLRTVAGGNTQYQQGGTCPPNQTCPNSCQGNCTQYCQTSGCNTNFACDTQQISCNGTCYYSCPNSACVNNTCGC